MKTRTRTIDKVMDEFFDTDEESCAIRDSYDAWAALERAEGHDVLEDLLDAANAA